MITSSAAPRRALSLLLADAELLGFASSGGARQRAKAAFVGGGPLVPPTITGFVASKTVVSGSGASTLEPAVTVSDPAYGNNQARDYYTVRFSGLVPGSDGFSFQSPPPGNGSSTCGGAAFTTDGVSNDPSTNYSPFPPPSGQMMISADDVTAFFRTFTFMSTAAPHDVTVTFADRNSYGTASQTLTIHVVAVAPTVTGGTANQPVNDNATLTPFTAVVVTDTSGSTTETVTVTLSNAANGTLSGGGFTAVAGSPGVYSVTTASSAAAQTALQAAVFTPTPNQVAPGGTVSTGFSITLANGTATSTPDTAASATATSINDVPTIAGTHGAMTSDAGTVNPFSGVTVGDPDTGQTETATVTLSSAANGTLSGAGISGSGTTYTATGSATQVTTALRGAVFTPTRAPAGTPATTTTFTLAVSDTVVTTTDGGTSVTASHTNNTAPTFGAFQTTATPPPAGSVVLQPSVTVNDPDVNAGVSAASVSIQNGQAGDVLGLQGAPPAGVTASYNPATYVLTFSGALTDDNVQAALRQVTFTHQGATDAGARTVAFRVTDDQNAAVQATETVNVSAYSTYTAPTTPAQTPSQQAGYTTQADNLIRVSPTDTALNDPTNPVAQQVASEQAIAQRLDSGQISAQDAQSQLFHIVDGTTSVAEISYAFFTGRTPTAAGLNFLVHSAANATDLNDAYYQRFTVENRYINFAANLATGQGAGAAAFQAAYGALSLNDATAKAYQAVFGITPTADKITAILSAQVSNGLGGAETRAQYLADITGGSSIAQKAAAIGFLLADSVKEGFGAYQQADLHFLQDLAHGTAAFNVDLLAAYGAAPSLVGQPAPDPTLGS